MAVSWSAYYMYLGEELSGYLRYVYCLPYISMMNIAGQWKMCNTIGYIFVEIDSIVKMVILFIWLH